MSSYLNTNMKQPFDMKQAKSQAGMLTEFTPIGDARAIAEIPELLQKKDYLGAGVNALSVLPVIGAIGDAARVGRKAEDARIDDLVSRFASNINKPVTQTTEYVSKNKPMNRVDVTHSAEELKGFDLKAPKKNRGTNVEGAYFFGGKNKENALDYGERTIIAVPRSGLKTFNRQEKTPEVSPAMLKEYKNQMKKAYGSRLDPEDLDDYVKEFAVNARAKWDVFTGSQKAAVLKAGGYGKYVDGDEIVILNPSDILMKGQYSPINDGLDKRAKTAKTFVDSL
jgi:hypothetical protein